MSGTPFHRGSRFLVAVLCLLAQPRAGAGAQSAWPGGIADDTETGAAPPDAGWSAPPSAHHRLFLDVYNITDFYDFETSSAAGFPDGTFLADTIRPTATLLWDDRFRIQLGVIALRGYGDAKGFGMVDPWIQLLWKPVQKVSLLFGNLDTPHYFVPALFYPLNYVRDSTREEGMQVLYQQSRWYDDLYFNYRRQDTEEHREKFDLGFVHRNAWRFLRFNYQAHWIHEGGELNPHDPNTVNDVAQAASAGVHQEFPNSVGAGAKFFYLKSHYRQDDSTNPAFQSRHDGDGELYEIYGRWRSVRAIAQSWHGHGFRHEGGDRLFTVDRMHLFTLRWDVLLNQDFSLMAEATGYFVGNNSEGIDKVMKSALHLQATWQFSIPIAEWTSPAVSPKGQPIPGRWDEGL